MKLKAEIGDKHFEIDTRRSGNEVTAIINGSAYELEVSEPEPDLFLIKHKGKIYEAYVDPAAEHAGTRKVTVNGRQVELHLFDPKRLRSSAESSSAMDGLAEIKTAMPGKVVRILKNIGDSVENGDGIIVVEAMKMQNELRSPKNGVVKEIRAAEGSTVSGGDVLALIE